MRPLRCITGFIAVVLLSGCGEEGPVALDELVPEDMIYTREIVLDASTFLDVDTTIGGFSTPSRTGYLIVGHEPDDEFDAHGLLRFERPARQVQYTDTEGATQTDSVPTVIGGELLLVVDTLQSRTPETYELALHRVSEAWDAATATWDLRVDSAGVSEPWEHPGAEGGGSAGAKTVSAGTDSILVSVDSATMAEWTETGAIERSLRISSPTPGLRVQIEQAQLTARYRPEPRPDTIVEATVTTDAATFIFTPDVESDDRLLVGGVPAWRTFFEFNAQLDTLRVPCPDDPDECTLRLRDASINYAALLLQPVTVSAGHAPADTIALEMRPVFGADRLPLSRAPLGDRLGAFILIGPESFVDGTEQDPVEAPITPLFAALLSSTATNAIGPARAVALVESGEPGPFGLAALGNTSAEDAAPRLRIIYSVTHEALLR